MRALRMTRHSLSLLQEVMVRGSGAARRGLPAWGGATCVTAAATTVGSQASLTEPGAMLAKGMTGGALANTLQPHSNSPIAKTGAIWLRRPNMSHPAQPVLESYETGANEPLSQHLPQNEREDQADQGGGMLPRPSHRPDVRRRK